VWAKLRDEVGKEEQVLHVMAVGHVEMPAFGERFDTLEVRGEAREVSGPERGGAFEHGLNGRSIDWMEE
jgi:hypothetical protein